MEITAPSGGDMIHVRYVLDKLIRAIRLALDVITKITGLHGGHPDYNWRCMKA